MSALRCNVADLLHHPAARRPVHIEADAKDSKGAPVHFVADGKLDDILSYRRTLTGTWNHGNVKGDFKLTRD